MILRDELDDLYSHWEELDTRFLDCHPELVAKTNQASDPQVLIDHFRKLPGLIRKFNIPEDIWFKMDEKAIMMGKSDRCKIICGRRGRGMTGNLAQHRKRELITVIDTICGDITVFPP